MGSIGCQQGWLGGGWAGQLTPKMTIFTNTPLECPHTLRTPLHLTDTPSLPWLPGQVHIGKSLVGSPRWEVPRFYLFIGCARNTPQDPICKHFMMYSGCCTQDKMLTSLRGVPSVSNPCHTATAKSSRLAYTGKVHTTSWLRPCRQRGVQYLQKICFRSEHSFRPCFRPSVHVAPVSRPTLLSRCEPRS